MATLPSDLHSIVVANSTIYEYCRTKNSIRIVQLYPGLDDEPLSCDFSNRDLEEAGSFEALGYCWGSTAADIPILYHGQPLRITEKFVRGLEAAMPCLSCAIYMDRCCTIVLYTNNLISLYYS